MRIRNIRLLLVCIAAFLISICGCRKESVPANHTEDERRVGEMELKASKAIAAGDLGSWISGYAENAAIYDERNPIILGKDAVRKAWGVDFARPDLKMSTAPRTVEISSGGDMAWAHGLFTITGKDAAGKPVNESFDYAMVYTRQPDGSWKIMADSANAHLHNRLFHRPDTDKSPVSWVAPFIGLACFGSALFFFFGTPILAIIGACKSYRARKLSTALLVSAVMFIAFLLTSVLLWSNFTAHYWNLSLKAALAAAGDTARYGNPVEDTSEGVLISLLVVSTLAGIVAGAITGTARHFWTRRRTAAA